MTTTYKTPEFREMFINKVEAETEKAYKISLSVSWNDNYHTRSFWFPKSVVVKPENDTMLWAVKTWFAEKMEKENAFHGYRMKIDGGFYMMAN